LLGGNVQVRFIELILDVPAKWSKEFSLLNESMEEAKAEEHLSEYLWLSVGLEPCSIRDWVCCIRTKEICLESHGWLICHLDTILKNGYREMIRWIRSKPKSEFSVRSWLLCREILANLFKSAHPRDSKMAILKHDPAALLDAFFYHFLGFWSLTFTKRNLVHLFLL